MKTLRVFYDGELLRDRWHPPVMEAMRVLPLALKQHCDRIRIERQGGALVTEMPVTKVVQYAIEHGYQIQPPSTRVETEMHRPLWAGHQPTKEA
jgi:hypothetical protein